MNKYWMGSATACIALALSAGAQAQDVDAAINGLPAELKSLYDSAPQTVLASAWDDWTPPAAPWRWCHSESFQGNPWRVTVTNELRRLAEGLDGVESFEISDSNGDPSQQINQIRTFIDKGCTLITSIPGSATALDDAIAAATDAGIPFITAAGSVTSPLAINVDSNFAWWGEDMIEAIARELPDGGNLLLVEGIAGHPIVVQEREGADRALAKHANLKVSRSVNGNWTANVTKTVILQALATNPAPIDAVWTTGSESRVVAEAFAQAGRPVPLITGSITGDALGYWRENPDGYRFDGHAVLPHLAAQTLYRVAARMLDGQKPTVNTLLMPIPRVHQADFDSWYESCMTPDAVSVFPIPPEDPVSESLIDAYFSNPAPTPGWDYAAVPGACE